MIRKILSGAGAIGASLYAATAWAQEAAEAVADTATAAAAAAPAPVAEAAAAVANPGNNAWMMTSTVLVLLMILPGLALFYGGLTRSKNMLSTMTQIGATAALAMVVWVLWAIPPPSARKETPSSAGEIFSSRPLRLTAPLQPSPTK